MLSRSAFFHWNMSISVTDPAAFFLSSRLNNFTAFEVRSMTSWYSACMAAQLVTIACTSIWELRSDHPPHWCSLSLITKCIPSKQSCVYIFGVGDVAFILVNYSNCGVSFPTLPPLDQPDFILWNFYKEIMKELHFPSSRPFILKQLKNLNFY